MITKSMYVNFIWILYIILGILVTFYTHSGVLGFIVPMCLFIIRMPTVRELYPTKFKGQNEC